MSADVDAVNVLRGGVVREREFENGSWRHRVVSPSFSISLRACERAPGTASRDDLREPRRANLPSSEMSARTGKAPSKLDPNAPGHIRPRIV